MYVNRDEDKYYHSHYSQKLILLAQNLSGDVVYAWPTVSECHAAASTEDIDEDRLPQEVNSEGIRQIIVFS